MPPMGYASWERFQTAIERAKIAAENSGMSVDGNFRGTAKVSGQRGPAQANYELSRYAAYLVALNGDPRKPETAAAQSYFVIRTREAEMAAPALTGPELMAAALIEAQATLAAKDDRIAELEPKAEFYDELMDADGCYSMKAVAEIIGWGRNVMMRDLRRMGILQSNNLPYRRYSHHFKVIPGTYTNRKTGETVPTATAYLLPRGVDFLRKRLMGSPAVMIGGDAA